MKKQLITAGVAIAVATAGVTGLGMASAATTNTSTSTNPMSSLVDAIATKFNLKKADVQAVVDAEHSKMEAQQEATAKTQLAQLVKDAQARLVRENLKQVGCLTVCG